MRRLLTRLGGVAAVAALGVAGFAAAPAGASSHPHVYKVTTAEGEGSYGSTWCQTMGAFGATYSWGYTASSDTTVSYPNVPYFTFEIEYTTSSTGWCAGLDGTSIFGDVQVTQNVKGKVFTLTGTADVYDWSTGTTLTEQVTVSFQATGRAGHTVGVTTTTGYTGSLALYSVARSTCTVSVTVGTTTYSTTGSSTAGCTLYSGVASFTS